MKGKASGKSDMGMIWFSIRAVVSTVPAAAIYVAAYLILYSVSGSVTGLLLEGITNAVVLKETAYFYYIVLYVAFFAVLQMAGFGYAIAMNTFVFEKVSDEMNRRLAKAMVHLAYFDFEKKEKLDNIYRARECVDDERISDCFMQSIRLFGTLVAIASALLIVQKWNIWLPVILLAFYLPEMIIRKKSIKAEKAEKESNVTLERERDDLWKTFFCKEAAKEIRTFHIGERLTSIWREKNLAVFAKEWAIRKTTLNNLFWAQLVKAGGLILCFVLLAVQCLNRELLVGALAGAISLLPALQGYFSEWGERRSSLKRNAFYVRCYYDVVNNDRAAGATALNIAGKIEVKNAVFGYDGGMAVLNGITFEILKGEKVAVVGENGTGKSTLIKCLLGLYPLEKGEIWYDATRLNPETPYDYRNISVMLHEFGKYSLTVAENIGFEKADAVDLSALQMENVFLGKEYGGTELSGGQWQRIALARCLHKKAELYILDEPTAYLDPIYERNVMSDLILKELKEKTVLIITHRLGICRLVDKIIVLDGSHRVVGVGSHEELMSSCAVYQKLYESQAKWYTEEANAPRVGAGAGKPEGGTACRR